MHSDTNGKLISCCYPKLSVLTARAVPELDLRSDHRAVRAGFNIGKHKPRHVKKSKNTRGWQPKLDSNNQPDEYHAILANQLQHQRIESLADLEPIIYNAAIETQLDQENPCTKPWMTDRIQSLIQQRRNSTSVLDRKKLSKLIQKTTRCELRKYHDQQIDLVLQEFADLNRIDGIHRTPVIRDEPPPIINPESFLDLLRHIYECPDTNIQLDRQAIKTIPIFDRAELLAAFRRMSNRRGADKSGIVVEMIKHGGGRISSQIIGVVQQYYITGQN